MADTDSAARGVCEKQDTSHVRVLLKENPPGGDCDVSADTGVTSTNGGTAFVGTTAW